MANIDCILLYKRLTCILILFGENLSFQAITILIFFKPPVYTYCIYRVTIHLPVFVPCDPFFVQYMGLDHDHADVLVPKEMPPGYDHIGRSSIRRCLIRWVPSWLGVPETLVRARKQTEGGLQQLLHILPLYVTNLRVPVCSPHGES